MPHVRANTRKDLLEKVSQFAQLKRVKISVVFDGAEEQSFPDGARFKGINVFYSQGYANADQRIKKFVESSKERRTLIVVTSDNALANFCRGCGAKVIRSPEFRAKIEDAQNSRIESVKQQGVKNDDIPGWLKYFGISESDKS